MTTHAVCAPGCGAMPAIPLPWFSSPCICTVAAGGVAPTIAAADRDLGTFGDQRYLTGATQGQRPTNQERPMIPQAPGTKSAAEPTKPPPSPPQQQPTPGRPTPPPQQPPQQQPPQQPPQQPTTASSAAPKPGTPTPPAAPKPAAPPPAAAPKR